MSYRVAQFHLDDFVLDYDSIADSLNDACHRDHKRYRISGVCQSLDDRVVVVFEQDYDGRDWRYVIKPFCGETAAEITGDVHSRWQGKFSTKGLIQLSGQALGIFEQAESVRKHVE